MTKKQLLGKKHKILFFPSAWSNESVFEPQLEALKDRYEIVFPNIHPFSDIEVAADFVVSHYQDVYAMVGLSMGGFIVQDILCRYPSFAEKAVLMGTYCHTHDQAVKAFFQSHIDKVSAGGFEEVIKIFTDVVISKTHSGNQVVREKISNLPRALGQTYCINHHKACISWKDHTRAVKDIKASVLILAGAEDGAVPRADLELLHNLIQGSQLKIISQAGHLMGLEEPEQVNLAIIRFLEE